MRKTCPETFWPKVDKSGGPDACWPWTGTVDPTWGYGAVGFSGKVSKAHRIAWQYTNGPIPDGMLVCHRCDNPRCCNPAHLFLGTASDNMQDMWDKSRHPRMTGDRNPSRTHPHRIPRGERQGLSKLTEQAVRDIRARRAVGETLTAIAKAHGVTKSNVSEIVRGNTWKHVA